MTRYPMCQNVLCNPFEKYARQNGHRIFPNFRGENKKIFETKPPPSLGSMV